MSKKLSEELRHCLDGDGCKDCSNYEAVKRHEDMEKSGRLRIFPCTIGDTVYRINKGAEQPIIPLQVLNFKIFNNNLVESFKMECVDEWCGGYSYRKTDIGRDVFITRQEAEAKMAEMEGKK